MNELGLSARIEAILFVRGEAVAREELKRILKTDLPAIDTALHELGSLLSERGLCLVDDGREVELRTAPLASSLIESMRKEELSRDIGKAGLETLAILLYKGPSTRSEVDFIRGVNSSHILRVLSIRGLVRKKENPTDERSFLYEPTTELLSHLGAARREDLPDFEAVLKEMEALSLKKEDSVKETPSDES
jgi:segregation and condensation protein B